MTKYEFLIQLAHNSPHLNIANIRLPLELLHHFKYMHFASITNQIYFPTPKQYSYDACLFDKSTKEPSLFIEYKFKTSKTNCFGFDKLTKLVDKYGSEGSNVDKIDIGFMHESLFHKQLRLLSEFEPKNRESIQFEASDFSSFFEPQLLTSDFQKTAETLFSNYHHISPELYEELGQKLLLL